MARPHHRKKHKEHLRQFKQKDEGRASMPKSKAASIMTVVGAVFGLGIGYIATRGDLFWMSVIFFACSISGYLLGRAIDKGKTG